MSEIPAVSWVASESLYVNEIFGPTIQGEGPSAGKDATFIRMAGCNLACSWCDTPYSWDWSRFDRAKERHAMGQDDIVDMAIRHGAMDTRLVVLTGGEPMLQRDRLAPVVARLLMLGVDVEVETAGTVAIDGMNPTRFVVSPKLASSRNKMTISRRYPILREYAARTSTVFKFVVANREDMLDADEVVGVLGLHRERVYAMPEGRTAEAWVASARAMAPEIIERGWRMSSRLHLLLWGTARGH